MGTSNYGKSLVGSSSDDDDLVYSFRNLGLGMNVNVNLNGQSKSTCLEINGVEQSSVAETQYQNVNIDKEFKRRTDKLPMITEIVDVPESSSIPAENFNSINGGNSNLVSDLHFGPRNSIGSLMYENNYNLGFEPKNNAVKLNGNTRSSINSCYGGQSNLVNQSQGEYVLSEPTSASLEIQDYRMNHNMGLYNTPQNISSNHRYMANGINDYDSRNVYYANTNLASSSASWNQYFGEPGQTQQLVSWAKTPNGSLYFQEVLQGRNLEDLNSMLIAFLPHIFELMVDRFGHHVFQRLTEACKEVYGLEPIVKKIFCTQIQSDLLTRAAFNQHGSISIQFLIKQLKKSDLAYVMTSLLSTGFIELMTNDKGRHVIKQCFIHLDDKTNLELFKKSIKHYSQLAKDPIGCLSLNDCIDFITGPQRSRLLHNISEDSVHLSQDPSGNFVVQHVLGLYDPHITDRICSCLRGHYVRLSFVKFGSHLVEKCIKFSTLGMVLAVTEFLESRRAHRLAQDQFGNYVIQTALKTTREAHIELYESLANELISKMGVLEHHRAGQHVIKLINSL